MLNTLTRLCNITLTVKYAPDSQLRPLLLFPYMTQTKGINPEPQEKEFTSYTKICIVLFNGDQ